MIISGDVMLIYEYHIIWMLNVRAISGLDVVHKTLTPSYMFDKIFRMVSLGWVKK